MKVLNEHLKKKSFKNVYLLYGEEAYLRAQYRDRLRSAMVAEGDTMNLGYFEGKGIDERELMALADTMPFFGDYRVIIVENSGFFASSSHDALVEYVKHIPETTCIVFVESDVDKRNKLFKAVSAAGYAANLTIPNDKQLLVWLAGMVKRENKLIQEQTLQYFLQLVEHDMNCMRQEMEKLLCYVGERQVIERSDVDAVCSVFVENKIFDMIRAIAEKNQHKALDLYDDLVTLKEAPMRILYLIIKQFDALHEIKDLVVKGYPASAIAERTGVRDFIVKRNMALARHFELSALRQAVEDGIDLEESVKTGRMTDRLAVEWMIQKYSR